MEQETVVAVRAERVDEEVSTKNGGSVAFSSGHGKNPEGRKRRHDATAEVVPKTAN